MLCAPFRPVRAKLFGQVRAQRPTPRHLKRPCCNVIGNILRAGQGCLIDTIIVPAHIDVTLRLV